MTAVFDAVVLERILELVRERAGLVFPESRVPLAEAAAERGMRRAGVRDPARYASLVAADAAAFDDLCAELTVGETFFFRDEPQIGVLADEVLPALSAANPGRRLRVWSAGCATGEEAYTLAILVHDLRHAGGVSVLGTDIAPHRLRIARRGRFREWALRGVSPERRARWFTRAGDEYQLAPSVHGAVEFRRDNLTDAPRAPGDEVGQMDLVLCRNVLIYLDADSIVRVARRLAAALRPGGWLFLGASDPSFVGLTDLESVVTRAGIAYHRRDARDERPAADTAARVAAPPARVSLPPLHAAPPVMPTVMPTVMRTAMPTAMPTASQSAPLPETEAACVARVRALADAGRGAEAGEASAAALERHPTSAELAYLHGALLAESGRYAEAAEAARRALYLDRSLAVAHLLRGSALFHGGETTDARRALRNAERLLLAHPAGDPVPAAGRESAAQLLDVVRAQLRLLDGVAA